MVQIGFIAIWAIAILVMAVASGIRGEWPERAGVTAALVAWLTSVLVGQLSHTWTAPLSGVFGVDILLLISLFVIGATSSKLWPLLACGFQLCEVCLHVAFWLQPSLWSYAYYVGLQITSCAVLLAIGVGVAHSFRSTGRNLHQSARHRKEAD